MRALPGNVFARRMQEERRRAGMSQAALAERVSRALGHQVIASAVSRIESLDRAVRLDEAVAIAGALSLPLAALLRDRDALDEEIAQLRDDLAMAEWQEGQARERLQEARDAASVIRRRIGELEAARDA